MRAGRAALLLWVCVLGGCLDQPLYVTDLRADADEDGGSDEADAETGDDAGQPRKDAALMRCQDCNSALGPFDPRGCLPGTWTEGCFQCGCCNEARECVRDWERDRRYECERPLPGKLQYGSCVDLDKRPNGGGSP